MEKYRTHKCNELKKEHEGKEVTLSGFVNGVRDHGGILFIDLRDMYGMTQVVIPDTEKEMQDMVSHLKKESVIKVKGLVEARPDDMINSNLETGEIEVVASSIEVIGERYSQLPFEVTGTDSINEDLRLKYRFLDLRGEKLKNNIIKRTQIISFLRREMEERGFMEIHTPILANSSPEGARDFLVPSRYHAGKFYALPQAPQQFKQLLMASGFDRYYQVAPCFRDEDTRSDRLPGEFYQLDMEMAFATEEDVFEVMEPIIYGLFTKFSDAEVDKPPFRRISYLDAMSKYGSDKPDLRNPLIIEDVSDIFMKTEFNAFKNTTVKVISVPDCASQPRNFFDRMIDFATDNGAKGLAWLKVENGILNGPIAKFIDEPIQKELIEATSSKDSAVLFFISDERKKAEKLMGIVRIELGKKLDLIEKNAFRFCWVNDFPMYEEGDKGKIDFGHNPFSAPQGGYEALVSKDPLDILAYQYDLVGNGLELSSGAFRNKDPKTMKKAFEIAGYSEEVVESKFPALYKAFHYGCPPHAGNAPGIDRLVMLLCEEENIRNVCPFPMNGNYENTLIGSPSVVDKQLLDDVHISVIEEE